MCTGDLGRMLANVASSRTTGTGSLAVEVACRVCGRPIVMVAVDDGTEIADRAEFLRVHHDCLVASVPEQREGRITPPGR